ncbi:MAG: hypothetical protein AAFO86_05290, partial [Pseudomonadota bacterium]
SITVPRAEVKYRNPRKSMGLSPFMQAVGACPVTQARARAVSITIATGFAAIGAGGVIMIGAVLPMLDDAPFAALMLALGFAALCLGLGFTHAMGTLRAALVPHQPVPAPDTAPDAA